MVIRRDFKCPFCGYDVHFPDDCALSLADDNDTLRSDVECPTCGKFLLLCGDRYREGWRYAMCFDEELLK